MASQINITPHQVPSSATQDKLKSLRSLDEGKSSGVTVRVTRKWEELDFISSNDVTSVDMVIVDEQGDELHAIIPKNLTWKFDKQIREVGLYTVEKLHLTAAKPKFRPAKSEKRGYFLRNTSLSALDAYSVSIIPHNFCFTEFEALKLNLQNIHLTDVVGFLKTITNIQGLNNEDCAMGFCR
ncbi:hypothetical protein MKW92_019823 [Papaver armeniacum]|nr:hypothetical protein MKW92_019823 [Papaver armeniacum]